MDVIVIDYGVYTELEVDLTHFDYTGIEKVVFTVKNYPDQAVIIEREFDTVAVVPVKITPEESKRLNSDAKYDFDIITTNGERYKLGDNGTVTIRTGCGQCQTES